MRRRLLLPLVACVGLAVGVWGTDADAAPRRGARVAKRRAEARARTKKVEAPSKTADSDLVPAATAAAPPPSRGPTRIDFDDRLVQGQTNKSGSIYLYDRKELKTRSMVKMRDSFREEIVGSVYDP